MKEKIIRSIKEVTHNGKKYTIMVMGSICETKEISGFYVLPVTFNGKNKKIRNIEFDKHVTIPGFNQYYAKTKTFNMGWAICNGDDKFSTEVGETICRRRYSKSPMVTQNGRFLTKDMCQAIVTNEVKYIEEHIADFLPKDGKKSVDDISVTCLDNAISVIEECKEKLKNNGRCPYKPCEGDYVTFTSDFGDKYVAIFKMRENRIKDFYVNRFYFLGRISNDNGLIDHVHSDVFVSFTKNKPFDFCPASDDDVKLINDYLKGARNYVWNNKTKSFRLVY